MYAVYCWKLGFVFNVVYMIDTTDFNSQVIVKMNLEVGVIKNSLMVGAIFKNSFQ